MMDTADRAGDSVLGTLLLYYTPEVVATVEAERVTWQDFQRDRQRVVYWSILAMRDAGQHVDMLTLEAFMAHRKDPTDMPVDGEDRRSLLGRVGGAAFLEFLALSASPGGLRDHARLVAEDGRWSRLARAVAEVEAGVQDRDDVAVGSGLAALARDARGGRPALRVVDAA